MDDMSEAFQRSLDSADENGKRLTFVVVVPTCPKNDDTEDNVDAAPPARRAVASSLRGMIDDDRYILHAKLRAQEHGYVEGLQHSRPTTLKESRYDTSVIVLQSVRAANDDDGADLAVGDDLKGT